MRLAIERRRRGRPAGAVCSQRLLDFPGAERGGGGGRGGTFFLTVGFHSNQSPQLNSAQLCRVVHPPSVSVSDELFDCSNKAADKRIHPAFCSSAASAELLSSQPVIECLSARIRCSPLQCYVLNFPPPLSPPTPHARSAGSGWKSPICFFSDA